MWSELTRWFAWNLKQMSSGLSYAENDDQQELEELTVTRSQTLVGAPLLDVETCKGFVSGKYVDKLLLCLKKPNQPEMEQEAKAMTFIPNLDSNKIIR